MNSDAESIDRSTPVKPKATLDAIAYASPYIETAPPERERLWPDVGWRKHLLVALVLLCAVVLAYGNSVTSLVSYNDKYRDIGYTLDNKYIIQSDPRTKAVNWDDPSTKASLEEVGKSNIWTKDYWWPKGISGLYRPVITWTYWFNWHVIGGDESKIDASLPADQRATIADHIRHRRFLWFHIVNFVSHLITSELVFCVGLLLIKRFWPAAAMAVLFAVHPVTVESVTNTIGRADIFAAIAGLGALLLYARAAVSRGFWKIPWLVALFVLSTIGLFCKESAVTILPALVAYDLIYRQPAWKLKAPSTRKQRLREMAGWIFRWTYSGYIAVIIPIIGMLTARYYVFAATTPPEEPFIDNPLRGVNWFAARLSAIQITVRSWKLCAWPFRLTADYSFNQVPPSFSPWSNAGNNWFAVASLFIVAAVIALAVWLWRTNRSRAAAYFICFFFITYMLTANLVYTIGAIMAERFLYLPLVGFLGVAVLGMEAAIGWAAHRIRALADADRPLFQAAAICAMTGLIALTFGIRTAVRNWDWRSDAALWRAALPVAPNSFRVYQSYAFALFEELNKPRDERQPETKDVTIDECIAADEKARPILESLSDRLSSTRLFLHLGMYYGAKGDAQVIQDGKGGITIPPGAVSSYNRAIEALERAVPIDRAFSAGNRQREIERGKNGTDVPDVGLFQIYEYLGNDYLRIGRGDKALEAFKYMRRLEPWDADAYMHIASVYLDRRARDRAQNDGATFQADSEQASIDLLQAMWLNSSRAELWPALNECLGSLCAPGSPPPIVVTDGKPKLNLSQPIVKSIICSSYQALVRTFLEGGLVANAESVRVGAVRDSGFPQQLFDDIFKEFGKVPPPIMRNPVTQPVNVKQSGELR